jgi:endo-1,4-beta-D-glucanase Y
MKLRTGFWAVMLVLPLSACGAESAAPAGNGGNSGTGQNAGGASGNKPGGGGGQSVAGTSNGGGAGTAGNSNGGSGQGGSGQGGAGGGTITPGQWHAATAAAVTEQMLQSEYSAWKTAHVKVCEGNASAIVVKESGTVVSEGIAYGMFLSANLGDRTLFDQLWTYYTDHLDSKGLMNWRTGECEAPGNNNQNAATDAELDAAMALIQAHSRWPDGGYLTDAQQLAAKILQHETEICDDVRILRPGDAWGGCSDPGSKRINPSYFAPGYYRVFAHYFPEQAEQWNELLERTYPLYTIYQTSMSGLVPDWSRYDGASEGSGYWYDACRTPWRVMVDYAWSADERAKTVLQGFSGWVDGKGGLPGAAQQNNSAFTGAFALSYAHDQAKFDSAVSAWLGASGDDKPYFQHTLRLLYLLAAAGKFPSTI